MKNLFLSIAIVAIISLNACSQTEKDVPAAVKSTFSQKFPDAKKVKWDKENDNEWEAEFKMNGNEYSANFDVDGTWKETEYEIKKSKIPEIVNKTLENEYAGYSVENAEVSETPEVKVFEFKLEKDESEVEVVINKSGTVIKMEKKGEEDEKSEKSDSEDEEDND